MSVRFDNGQIVVTPESEAVRDAIAAWAAPAPLPCTAHVDSSGRLVVTSTPPLNIAFDDTPMPYRLISNLAATPFELDGRRYASIEGFWQGLKLPGETDRARIAALDGHAAKSAGHGIKQPDVFLYEGRGIRAGTVDHWELMERATRAKLDQHAEARAALLATGTRPLEHKVPVDSRTIPGIVMADIWTRIRKDMSG